MKKIFNNNRLIAFAFLTVFSFGAITSASASVKDPENVPVELKYAGEFRNQPVFELSFKGNSLQDNFTILINDEVGNSLYRENFKGEIFTKKFAINTEELGETTLRFVIYCNNTKKSITYEVNRNTRTVHDIAIVETK